MYEYKAKLIKVVDGDTVDAMIDCGFSVYRKERIRLLGINAPETRTRDKKEKEKGLIAKARLKELIKDGRNEFMVKTFLDGKGKYGRLLGVLYNLGSEEDEESEALQSQIAKNFTPLAGFAFMLFVLLYTPCIVALVTLIREMGSWKWSAFSVVYQLGLAYGVAVVVYQIGKILGLG